MTQDVNVKEGCEWTGRQRTPLSFIGLKKSSFLKDIGHLVRCLPLVLIRDLKSSKIYLNRLARLALKESIKHVKSA